MPHRAGRLHPPAQIAPRSDITFATGSWRGEAIPHLALEPAYHIAPSISLAIKIRANLTGLSGEIVRQAATMKTQAAACRAIFGRVWPFDISKVPNAIAINCGTTSRASRQTPALTGE